MDVQTYLSFAHDEPVRATSVATSAMARRLTSTSRIAARLAQRWPALAIVVVRIGHPTVEVGNPEMFPSCRMFAPLAALAASEALPAGCVYSGLSSIRVISRPLTGGYAMVCGVRSDDCMRAITRSGARFLEVFEKSDPW
jgi:hypothetical protein